MGRPWTPGRGALQLVGFAAGYALLNQAGLSMLFADTGLAVFWPAAGLSMAVAARARRSALPWVLGAVVGVNFVMGLAHGRTVTLAVVTATANLVETGAGGLLLRRWLRPGWLRDPRAHLRYTVAVALACAAGGTVGSLAAAGDARAMLNAGLAWFVSDGVGALVVAQALLPHRPGSRTRPAAVQVAILAAQVGVVVAVFGTIGGPLAFVAIGAIAATSLLLSPWWAAAATAVSATCAVWLTAAGRGPLAGAGWAPEAEVAGVAGFVLVASLVSITLTQTLAERHSDGELLRLVLDLSRAAIARHDAAGDVLLANPAWRRLGGPDARLISRIDARDRPAVEAAVRRPGEAQGSELEARLTSYAGDQLLVSVSTAATPDGGSVTTVTDTTAFRRARDLEVLGRVLEHAPTATMLLGGPPSSLTVLLANRSASALLGAHDGESLNGVTLDALLAGRPAPECDALRRVLERPGTGDGRLLELTDLHAGPAGPQERGAATWVQVSCTDLADVDEAAGARAGAERADALLVLQLEDVTVRRQAEEELRHLMLHDPLTGLPNRRLFADRLEHALAAARREAQAVAVVFVDLDRFKQVNDSLGHHAGDQLLQHVARRLQSTLRSADTVARMGGDEFAVIAPLRVGAPPGADGHGAHGAHDATEAHETGDVAGQAARVAQRLREALSLPALVDGEPVHVSASIGIAVAHPVDGDDVAAAAGDLLRSSDLAMYSAKLSGPDRTHVFEPGMRQRAERVHQVEETIRAALELDWVRVHYQPLRDRDGTVFGLEALARIEHPRDGLLLPAAFLSVAEASGLIDPLGERVLAQLMADYPVVVAALGDGVRMFYNVSTRQQVDGGLVEMVVDCARRAAFPLDALVLEITESAALEPLMHEALHALHSLGVALALDDFGTGYSALAYLRRLPLDILKVDRSFVSGTSDGTPDRDIIAALVGLSRGLGLTVVTEGVETAEQHATTMDLGSDLFQGYGVNRPAALVDLVDVVRTDAGLTRA